jgi:hypothetical protein
MRAGLPRPRRQPRLIVGAGLARGQRRSTAAGQGLGSQPPSPSVCWTITGGGCFAPGQDVGIAQSVAGLVVDHVAPVVGEAAGVPVGSVPPSPSVDHDVRTIAAGEPALGVQRCAELVGGLRACQDDAKVGAVSDADQAMLLTGCPPPWIRGVDSTNPATSRARTEDRVQPPRGRWWRRWSQRGLRRRVCRFQGRPPGSVRGLALRAAASVRGSPPASLPASAEDP